MPSPETPAQQSPTQGSIGDSPLAFLLNDATYLCSTASATFTSVSFRIQSVAERGRVQVSSWLLGKPADEDDAGRILLLRVDSADGNGAVSAAAIGQFDAGGNGQVRFSGDVDTLPQGSITIMAPSPESLSAIASFSPGAQHQTKWPLGVVRFSQATTAAEATGVADAGVFVNIDDFIGGSTAVFGMTRSGKSNTIKTLVTTVRRHNAAVGRTLGQVIFDPQGEYSEDNPQDGVALRTIGDEEQVRLYRSIPGDDPRERPLLLNFYDPSLFAVVWDVLIRSEQGIDSPYAKAFVAADAREPSFRDADTWETWSRCRLAVYAMLYRAGYAGAFPDSRAGIVVAMRPSGAAAYNRYQQHLGKNHHQLVPVRLGENGWVRTDVEDPTIHYLATTPEVCSSVMAWVDERIKLLEATLAVRDPNSRGLVEDLTNQLGGTHVLDRGGFNDTASPYRAVSGLTNTGDGYAFAGIAESRALHDPAGSGDVAEHVWNDMMAGRLAIVDLSVGDDLAVKAMSAHIVRRLHSEAAERFRHNEPLIGFNVIVEEAHNLFERGAIAREDPWVRLAKEAAKFGIGLVYSTQEVTSIDRRVLANTRNWVVGHLNSRDETDELARYYEFADHTESIRRVEAPGYVRLKTRSMPFIVPTQVHKFTVDLVNSARADYGLDPLPDGQAG